MIAQGSIRAESEIEIGKHTTFEFAGMTFNSDTMLSTVVAGAIVIIFGLLLRSQVTDGVPGKVQLLWESLVGWVNGLVEGSIGRLNPFIVPLAVALFIFILIGNWFEVVPTGHRLPPPAADTNVTYALAILVIVSVHVFGVREQGGANYVKGYAQPFAFLLPLNLIEEIAKPFSLALRLFGNIFAGGVILSLLGLAPDYVAWAPEVIWKLFGMAIGGIQAFIFALLTILYFGFAASGHGGGHDDDDPKHEESKPREKQSQPA